MFHTLRKILIKIIDVSIHIILVLSILYPSFSHAGKNNRSIVISSISPFFTMGVGSGISDPEDPDDEGGGDNADPAGEDLYLRKSESTQVMTGSMSVGQTGSANYSIPISVPAGVAGMQPELSVNYNSQGGNGPLGIGWSLGGLSSISRCPTTLVQDGFIDGVDFDNNDKFCLGGKRLVAIEGTYGADGTEYRLENGNTLRIYSRGRQANGPTWFETQTKSGQTMHYGNSEDSRVEAQRKSDVLTWAINQIEDASGNQISINYLEDRSIGEHLPQFIYYGNNKNVASTTDYAEIEFIYQTREDIRKRYISGSILTTSKRLKKIVTRSNQAVIDQYNFDYRNDGVVNQSKLRAIQQCNAEDSCKRPIWFKWDNFAEDSNNFRSINGAKTLVVASYRYGTIDINRVRFGDFNGDGLMDTYYIYGYNSLTKDYIQYAQGDGNYYGTYGLKSWVSKGADSGHTLLDFNRMRFLDFNGDGLTDIYYVHGWGSNGQDKIHLSKGDGTYKIINGLNSWVSNWVEGAEVALGRIKYGDFNGDGLTDIYYVHGWNSHGLDKIHLSKGDGTYKIINGLNSWIPGREKDVKVALARIKFADFNGDGLTDIYYVHGWNSHGLDKIHLSNGDGTYQVIDGLKTWVSADIESGHFAMEGLKFADFNGDGLTDIYHVRGWGNTLRDNIHLSKGDGTYSVIDGLDTYVVDDAKSARFDIARVKLGDFNGDGLSDIYYVHGWDSTARDKIHLSKGGGKYKTVDGLNTYISKNGTGKWIDINRINIGDFNSDGKSDIYYVWGWGHPKTTDSVNLSNHPRPVINTFVDGSGTESVVNYKTITDKSIYNKGSGAQYPIQDIQSSLHVVNAVKTSDGYGGFSDKTYAYGGAKTHLKGRGFLGFKWMNVKDEQTGIYTTTEYRQDYPFIGQVDYSRTYREAGGEDITLTEQENTWTEKKFYAGKVRAPYNTKSVAHAYELNAPSTVPVTTTTTETIFDDYANATKVTVTTQGKGETFIKDSVNWYHNDIDQWHLGRLYCAQVTSHAPGVAPITRLSGFHYNGDGLLSKEIIEPRPGDVANCISDKVGSNISQYKSYQYDAFGNQTESSVWGQGTAKRTSATLWGERNGSDTGGDIINNGRFPVESVNQLGHRAKNSYDTHFGVKVASSGPNGITTRWEYDEWGRAIREIRADGTQSVTGHYFCPAAGLPCPAGARNLVYSKSTGSGAAITYFDYLGREIRKLSQAFDGRVIYTDTEFYSVAEGKHAYGKIKRQSRPYFPGDVIRWNLKSYDVLGRGTREIRPDGSVVHMAYQPFKTIQTDHYGRVQIRENDALGGLSQVIDAAGGRIHYHRNAVGDVLTTTVSGPVDSNPITTNLTYDAVGRKVAMDDPDMGHWEYEYNAYGELVKQINAKGDSQELSYDVLGRMVQRVEPEGLTTWSYDTAEGAGIGKIHIVQDANGTRNEVKYDHLGRTLENKETISGEAFIASTTYDAIGRPDTLTYPTGHTVKNQYSSYGALIAVSSPSTSETYWELDQQDALGNITEDTLGNGLKTHRSFSPATGLVEWIKSGNDAAPSQVQDLSYSFDVVGNLIQRTDERIHRTETFSYDALYRLTSATVSEYMGGNIGDLKVAKFFLYDSHGNITYKSDVGHYQYGRGIEVDGAGPHAVVTAGNEYYSYDANGNMLEGAGKIIEWSSFDKPIRITKNDGAESRFVYGPDRSRVQQTKTKASGEQTIIKYLGTLYEQHDEDGYIKHIHYIKANGRTAIYTTSDVGLEKTRYLHKDHLGSIDVITDEQGEVAERNSFDAWGKRRETSWQDASYDIIPEETSRGFTDHEHLDELGLVHMNGRVYDPTLGRFLSADPNIQQPDASQNYNRYTYVNNNPLSYTDPSGFFFKKLFKAIGKFFKKFFKSILHLFVTTIAGLLCGPCAAIAAATISGIFTAVEGGDFGDILKSVAISVASAVAFNFIGGDAFGEIFGGGITADIARIGAHGLVGGVRSVAQGGSFIAGFASGAFGKIGAIGSRRFDGPGLGNIIGRGLISTIAGGIGAELGGGKFVNGAITGAMGFVFNEAHSQIHLWHIHKQIKGGRLPEYSTSGLIRWEAYRYKKWHKFKIKMLICTARATGCNESYADKVFKYVNANDVPLNYGGADTPGEYMLFPYEGIKHTEDVANRTSRNETLDSHMFHPGSVSHRVSFTKSGLLVYEVIGTGTGGQARFNNYMGRQLFPSTFLGVAKKFGALP